MHPGLRRSLLVFACAAAAGCAAKRPVLYPNPHYRSVGVEVAQADIDTCMRMAETGVGDSNHAAETAGSGAVGAGTGAAVGAVGGAIGRGGAGTGAAVGAATGGMLGLFRGLWRWRDHDPIYMAYVDTCLSEKGYRPLGWR